MTGRFHTSFRFAWLLPAALLMSAPLASAQAEDPASVAKEAPGALTNSINTLPALLRGEYDYDHYFDDAFKQAVPKEKWQQIVDGLAAQLGQPQGIASVEKSGPYSATVQVAYEKGSITVALTVNNEWGVGGLLIKAVSAKDDSIAKIDADFASLPGMAGYVVEELGPDGASRVIAGRNADTQFAIGSTFKLYILAELVAEIQAGERKWSEVTTLPHRTYSAPAINRWPDSSAVTLQSLATWMISVSDNRATDNLLYLLGREQVESKLAMIGHSNPEKMLPFLSTIEAFALKSPDNAALRDAFLKASESRQRALIAENTDKLGYDEVDPAMFAGGPLYIDTIEWFASPSDIGLVLNNIRRSQSKEALDILAVNPGVVSPGPKWKYIGYKGGSEPGVISMSYLLQTASGRWFVISGSWNDKTKAVDDSKFSVLMARLADQIAQ